MGTSGTLTLTPMAAGAALCFSRCEHYCIGFGFSHSSLFRPNAKALYTLPLCLSSSLFLLVCLFSLSSGRLFWPPFCSSSKPLPSHLFLPPLDLNSSSSQPKVPSSSPSDLPPLTRQSPSPSSPLPSPSPIQFPFDFTDAIHNNFLEGTKHCF